MTSSGSNQIDTSGVAQGSDAAVPASSAGYDERLEAVLTEYLQAADAGLAPDAETFAAAHPEFDADLRDFLTSRSRLDRITALFAPSSLPITPAASSTLMRMPPASADRPEVRCCRIAGRRVTCD